MTASNRIDGGEGDGSLRFTIMLFLVCIVGGIAVGMIIGYNLSPKPSEVLLQQIREAKVELYADHFNKIYGLQVEEEWWHDPNSSIPANSRWKAVQIFEMESFINYVQANNYDLIYCSKAKGFFWIARERTQYYWSVEND